jgi:geranylgeranyl diphosphate synthase type II
VGAGDEPGGAGRVDLEQYLADCGSLVRDEIERLFGAPGGHPAPMLYDLILDYPLRGGKALRPTLAIAMCRALGGLLEAVLPTAATLELYHNAFLIHDDVEDESEIRRGRPTLHADHGVPIAVNVGDAMLTLSLEPLLANVEVVGLGPALKILAVVARMSRESVEGQAVELAWVRHNTWDLTDDDYRRMVVQKTGWYSFIAPLQVGAVVAGVASRRVDALVPLGRELGIAFQVTDDLLNLQADVERYGKEIGGDLWEGKRTVMLLHAVRTADARDRARAIEILGRPRPASSASDAATAALLDELVASGDLTPAGRRRWHVDQPVAKTDADVAWLLDLVTRQGSLDHAAALARAHADEAARVLDALEWLPDNRHVDVVRGVIDYVHERTR